MDPHCFREFIIVIVNFNKPGSSGLFIKIVKTWYNIFVEADKQMVNFDNIYTILKNQGIRDDTLENIAAFCEAREKFNLNENDSDAYTTMALLAQDIEADLKTEQRIGRYDMSSYYEFRELFRGAL